MIRCLVVALLVSSVGLVGCQSQHDRPPLRVRNVSPKLRLVPPQEWKRDDYGIPIMPPEHRAAEEQWLKTQSPRTRKLFQHADQLVEEARKRMQESDDY
jgi:hypothetical protein